MWVGYEGADCVGKGGEMIDDADYVAAEEYLTLHYNKEAASAVVRKLREAPIMQFKAVDIRRAAKITEWGMRAVNDIGPVLLVRNSNALVVAAGYDRVANAFPSDRLDCKIV